MQMVIRLSGFTSEDTLSDRLFRAEEIVNSKNMSVEFEYNNYTYTVRLT
jgi:hypothetical protein